MVAGMKGGLRFYPGSPPVPVPTGASARGTHSCRRPRVQASTRVAATSPQGECLRPLGDVMTQGQVSRGSGSGIRRIWA